MFQKHLPIKKDKMNWRVIPDSVIVVMGMEHYSQIWSDEGEKFIYRESIGNLVALLNCPFLVRVSRSYFVHYNYIRAYSRTEGIWLKKAFLDLLHPDDYEILKSIPLNEDGYQLLESREIKKEFKV